MKKNRCICSSIIYFVSVIASIILLDSLFAISLEMAIGIILSSVLLYLIVALFLIIRSKFHPKDKTNVSETHVFRIRHKRNIIMVCFLTGVMLCTTGYMLYDSANSNEIPWSLTEFGTKYPEASGFVRNYHKYKDIPFDADIGLNISKGEIPLFIQWDKRWGYQYYGNDLLGINGCGPTCISMVVCGLTGNTDWNPYRIAQFSEENGYYIPGEGTSWDLMTCGAEKLGLHTELGIISADYIRENLSASTPMICSMYPGDFTYTGHFIVLTGIDSNGNVIVNDPNSNKNSQKSWGMEELVPQIRSIWKCAIL